MKTHARWLIGGSALLIATVLPMVTQSLEEGGSLVEMVKNAKTKADHEALASHYEIEAKSLQAKAEEHRRTGEVYGVMPYTLKSAVTFTQHCNSVASDYEKAADENRALAKLHHELAAGMK
jgi:hypothetical protein